MTNKLSAYVNVGAMQAWETKMMAINNSAITTLNNFLSTINQISDSWDNTSSTAFLNQSDAILKAAISLHDKMCESSRLLEEIVITMEKE